MISGKNMRRPAWTQLREMLWPGDVVVVPRIDRLAGNLAEGIRTVQYLHDQGIHIRALPKGLDTGDDSPTSHLQANAAHAALPGGVGAGDHPGPDQGRRGPRRGRGPDGRQASGAGLREGGGRQEFPGERRVGQRRRQDIWGEPPHREGGQGWDVRGTTRLDLTPRSGDLPAQTHLHQQLNRPGESRAFSLRFRTANISHSIHAGDIHGKPRLEQGGLTYKNFSCPPQWTLPVCRAPETPRARGAPSGSGEMLHRRVM